MRFTLLGKALNVFLYIYILLSFQVKSQSHQIGAGIGALSYSGDLNRGYNLSQNRPAITAFYRAKLNATTSFKTGITAGKLIGSDEKGAIDAFSNQRNASFDIFLFEVAGVFEYHFLDWRSKQSLVRWTPYFFGGLGLFGMFRHQNKPEEYSYVQPVLPFGLGFKYNINPKWYFGVEGGARKTFFDYLDNVSEGDLTVKDYQYGNTNDNDMYYFIGFTITYTFYTIPCPFPYKH